MIRITRFTLTSFMIIGLAVGCAQASNEQRNGSWPVRRLTSVQARRLVVNAFPNHDVKVSENARFRVSPKGSREDEGLIVHVGESFSCEYEGKTYTFGSIEFVSKMTSIRKLTEEEKSEARKNHNFFAILKPDGTLKLTRHVYSDKETWGGVAHSRVHDEIGVKRPVVEVHYESTNKSETEEKNVRLLMQFDLTRGQLLHSIPIREAVTRDASMTVKSTRIYQFVDRDRDGISELEVGDLSAEKFHSYKLHPQGNYRLHKVSDLDGTEISSSRTQTMPRVTRVDLKGIVVDQDGIPVPEATVYVTSQVPGRTAWSGAKSIEKSATTDARGKFHIRFPSWYANVSFEAKDFYPRKLGYVSDPTGTEVGFPSKEIRIVLRKKGQGVRLIQSARKVKVRYPFGEDDGRGIRLPRHPRESDRIYDNEEAKFDLWFSTRNIGNDDYEFSIKTSDDSGIQIGPENMTAGEKADHVMVEAPDDGYLRELRYPFSSKTRFEIRRVPKMFYFKLGTDGRYGKIWDFSVTLRAIGRDAKRNLHVRFKYAVQLHAGESRSLEPSKR